jgi:hypothetical protein
MTERDGFKQDETRRINVSRRAPAQPRSPWRLTQSAGHADHNPALKNPLGDGRIISLFFSLNSTIQV